jgi:hypothetical protein
LQASADKAELLAETRRQTVELKDLPNQPPENWPPPIAELVAHQVQEAARSAVQELQQTASRNLEAIEAEHDKVVEARAELAAKVERLSSELEGAHGRIRQVEVEMKEQERVLQERIQGLGAELTGAKEVAGEAEELRVQVQELREDLQEADARAAEMQAKLEEDLGWGEVNVPVSAEGGQASGEMALSPRVAGGEVALLPRVAGVEQAASPSGKPEAAIDGMVQYWKGCYENAQQRVAALEAEVSGIQAELRDERYAHELRSLSDGAKQDEIADLRACQGRGNVDVEYLKNALLGFFESGELPANAQVFAVLERLLCLTEKDKARLHRAPTSKGGRLWTPSKSRSGFSLFA